MRIIRIAPALLLLILAVFAAAYLRPTADAATTFTVNSAGESQDTSCTPDPGGCTLPDAIAAANATGGADIIHFNTSLFPPDNSGPAINLSATLPAVNATDGITIDGTGAGVRINATVNTINALTVQTGNGVPAQNVTIKHLAFTGSFSDGIFICGGISAFPDFTCPEDVSNVTVQDISIEFASTNGIFVHGDSGSHIALLDNTFPFAFSVPIFVSLTGSSSDIEIARNQIDAGGFSAGINVYITATASNISIHDNTIMGTNWGIYYGTVGGHNNSISHNTIHGSSNYSAISIISLYGFEDTHVTISQNSTYDNHRIGIDLEDNYPTANDTGDADIGANDLLNYPVITASDAQSVSGAACSNCTIELFVSDNDPSGYGEGQTYLADTTSDNSGDFDISICGLGLAPPTGVTATATDSLGNTSEFSLNYTLAVPSGACPTATPSPTHSPTPAPTPTHTPTPTQSASHKQGDLDCSGSVNAKDALRPIRSDAGVPQTQPGGCPQLTSGTPAYGDVTCDGSINTGDTIAILEYTASLPITPPQQPGCAPLGTTLSS